MSLVALVLDVHRQLTKASLAHAFGGALALAYVSEPRGTIDVDINVFTPFDEVDVILEVLASIDLRPEHARADWLPVAGIRLRRVTDPYPVDLFASLDDRYAEIERRCVRRPFGRGDAVLPFLSAEDLAMFKLSFGRDKDWVDLRAIVLAQPNLDVDYIERQLVSLRGPSMYPRVARLRSLVRSGHRSQQP